MEEISKGKHLYGEFQLEEIEFVSKTDQGESRNTEWQLSRIEGGIDRIYRRDHGRYPSRDAAKQSADRILEKEAKPPKP
jgi:hypothetical protein